MKKFLLKGDKDFALLFLRITIGGFMLFGHGWSKLTAFGEYFHSFSDPLGLGPEISYILTVGAEVLCSVFIILGLFTRFAAIPLAITMIVAAFIILKNESWNDKEFALLYLIPYITIFIAGPGRYSVDRFLFKIEN